MVPLAGRAIRNLPLLLLCREAENRVDVFPSVLYRLSALILPEEAVIGPREVDQLRLYPNTILKHVKRA